MLRLFYENNKKFITFIILFLMYFIVCININKIDFIINILYIYEYHLKCNQFNIDICVFATLHTYVFY
jgi:hypothetical protein